MAADDNVDFPKGWIHLQVLNVVKHINGNASCSHDLDLRNSVRPRISVVIPANRHNARQSSQAVQDFRVADITRMKNQTDPIKNLQHLWTQKPVCIGNNTDNLIFTARHQAVRRPKGRYAISNSAYFAIIFLRP